MNYLDIIKDLINKKDLFELHSFLEFNGIDINCILSKEKDTLDPLTYAIETHSPDEMIRFLIEKYHDLNYETRNGKIPIFCAVESQNFKISDELLFARHHPANINYMNAQDENILVYLLNRNALTKKALLYTLNHGVNVNMEWNKRNSVLTRIIDSHKDNVEAIMKKLFHTTVFTNKFIIQLLIFAKSRTSFTSQQFKKLLDEEKAKIHITKRTYKCVIDNGLINLLQLLFNHDIHFDLKTKSFDELNGYGLMLRALLFNQYDILNYLIQYGLNKNKIYKNFFTPLTFASYTHIDKVKFLVERGADLNVIDGYGHTPLMIASGYGKMSIVQYLVEQGADIHKKNAKDYTALLLSSKYGHFSIVRFLVENGANLQDKNYKGDNALHLCMRYGNLDIIKYFIENGIDKDGKDNKGYNILMLAAYYGFTEIVQYLLGLGMDWEVTNSEGLNTLDFARKGVNSEVVDYLENYIQSLKQKKEKEEEKKEEKEEEKEEEKR